MLTWAVPEQVAATWGDWVAEAVDLGPWEPSRPPSRRWVPPVDCLETEEGVVVRCEVPGVAPEDLVVSLSPGRLVVAGEKRDEDYARLGRVCRMERRFGEFRRLIPLPADLDLGRAATEHRNGVLTVRIPRVADATARRVPIRKGFDG